MRAQWAILGAAMAVALSAAACGDDGARTAPVTPPGRSASAMTTSPAVVPTPSPPSLSSPGPTATASRATAAGSAGCAAASVLAVGDDQVSVSYRGVGGVYRRHLPPAYDGRTPLPLVVSLHGYGQSLDDMETASGLPALGARTGFVTVTPQIDHGVPHWEDTLGSADLAWIGGLLDDLASTLCLDPARVYVQGLSNGAMMASAIACEFSDRIAAIAPVAGLRNPAGCTPSRPVPVIAVHGTADTLVAYDGGYGPELAARVLPDARGSLAGVLSPDGPSVPDMAAAWAARGRVRWWCPERGPTRRCRHRPALLVPRGRDGGAPALPGVRSRVA